MSVAEVVQNPGPIRTPLSTVMHGRDSLASLPDLIDGFGAGRVLLLAGPHAARGAAFARAKKLLGPRCAAVYDQVVAHTPIDVVEEVTELVRREGVDAIVAVGGGSTSDTAKAVATHIGEGRPLEELTTYFEPPDRYVERWLRRPKMPIVTIPGTLSGAESGPRFGFTGRDRIKRICGGDYVATRALILDPEATLDTDLDVFLRSGMNGLAHAVEGLYSRRRSPVSDAAGLEATRLFTTYLPAVRTNPDDLDARLQLLYANYLGSVVLASARICIHHAVCHVLGARLGLSHSDANAVMLPHSMAFNRMYATGPLARIERTLGAGTAAGRSPEELAQAAVDRVFELQERIEAPRHLRDLPNGLAERDIAAVAQDVMIERGVFFNPRPIDGVDDVVELLRSAA